MINDTSQTASEGGFSQKFASVVKINSQVEVEEEQTETKFMKQFNRSFKKMLDLQEKRKESVQEKNTQLMQAAI